MLNKPRLFRTRSCTVPVLDFNSPSRKIIQSGIFLMSMKRWSLAMALCAVSYSGAAMAADSDGDGVDDSVDNCILAANADQRETSVDGFGNACDPDLNNDSTVNVIDLDILKSVFFSSDPDADFNGDGFVNAVDLGILKSLFLMPPGPSASVGIPPDDSIPVGSITADILRGPSRSLESAAVNLVADAQAWATLSNGAEIAFMNPGGVRADLLFAESAGEGDGVVTYLEALNSQPFSNTLITLPMTGAQIVSVLEDQCQPPGSGRTTLILGVSDGFAYDLEITSAATDCTSITISNVKLNGVDLNFATTYLVTVNSFLAGGGDNFSTFNTIDLSTGIDGGVDLLALMNYLATFGPVAPPGTDRVNEIP